MTVLRPRVLRSAGVFALGLAVLAAVGALPAGARDAIAPLANESVAQVAVVGVAVAVAFSIVATEARPDGSGPDPAPGDRYEAEGASVARPFETAGESEGHPVGYELQRPLAGATGTRSGAKRIANERRVRETLEEAAVTAVARSEGISRAAAAERVADGSWTDSPRAAVLLGDAGVATVPLRHRIVDWLYGNPFERRVNAAVVEIAARADVETEVTAP